MPSGRKGRRTADEERKLMSLVGKSFDYLNNNFENFSDRDKRYIALEIVKKRIPINVQHDGELSLKLAEEIKAARTRVAQYEEKHLSN